ncbi:MAG: carboxypeptidase-like regulatory domain-containing protein, partial [Ignavibacteriaceae bacterium]
MKKIFIFLILLLNTTFAQKYDITGVIGDKETGKPLSFANIRIDKTTDGTTSNYDGQFILNLSAGNYKLIFSYVGYKTDTILVSVPSNNQINIYLQPEAVKLSEIVVSASED